jgi:hypothetical protein
MERRLPIASPLSGGRLVYVKYAGIRAAAGSRHIEENKNFFANSTKLNKHLAKFALNSTT